MRAALELAILGSLTGGPLHGYAVAQSLQQRGFGLLRGGSLYPVLARLETDGHVRASWVEGSGGPGRKDYTLTTLGRAHLAESLAAWHGLTEQLTKGGQ